MGQGVGPMYAIQPAFTTGEISYDVANRVDLEKYKSALLRAKNAIIRPYGAACRRGGSEYIGETKYPDKDAILARFARDADNGDLLEFGDKYIRVWHNGKDSGEIIDAPFTQAMLKKLRFAQSADTLFICSGDLPVYTLVRDSGYSWTGDWSGNWTLKEYEFSHMYFESEDDYGSADVTPYETFGNNVEVVAHSRSIHSRLKGAHLQVTHRMPAQSVKVDFAGETTTKRTITSAPIYVGKQWKITTSGLWAGDVFLEYSYSGNGGWKEFRRYSSDKNFNATESGTVDEEMYLRISAVASGSSLTATLTRLPYMHEGEAVINSCSGSTLNVSVIKPFGSTDTTKLFSISPWDAARGYPRACCFYQDRLVLAGTRAYPHKIWLSRTGDYANFSVEKAAGQVTDDSAVALSLISREMYNILHLVPAQDLIVLTDGNEWIVPGDKPITPKTAQVKTQTMRGSAECEPVYIGNRLVYVQARGATVRDMGYSYESDNYNGIDLTLLAKHLVQGHSIVTAAYAQEPDSVLYMVRDDGVLLCLTLIREQDVYGWSHWTTDGKYLWVETVQENGEESVYVIVERNGKRCIERFRSGCNVYMDSYVQAQNGTIQVPHLQGKTIAAVAGNKRLPDGTETSIQADAAGLSYETKIEQPGVELQLNNGTVQARTIRVNEVTLRVSNSKGGKIGHNFKYMDALPYPSAENFTGDILAVMPNTDVGFNTRGRVCVSSDEPFPLNVLAIIRSISVGGGHVQGYNG
ncbi:hypothetical protein [Negativicoccus succinicivorans]|uniref:phage nozzle protein n=1 Tax=Negativicoccus succinicivorans TaxID=620903 RepID=UPI002902238C|nr:hypothetical protein [Negativicoccus succinicivorans]MDU2417869.1 hypothetical protein [Negativicoccus succinicivorans]